jgi:cobalt/nickel transport system ATP-binding protein
LIFQNPDDQLFSTTVFEDVAFGLIYQGLDINLVSERVKLALEVVQIAGSEDRNPYHLSTGEKKRIAIATVLSMHPEILILDEPTAGLDPRGKREFIELLKKLPQTMLIATHDLDLAEKVSERIILISDGHIRADGSTKDILLNKDLLEKHGLY